MAPSLEAAFDNACRDKIIPGAVLMAANKDGTFTYEHASGARAVAGLQSMEPIQLDTVFSIFSCTKLLTSIAALQCVERGLLALDDDVAPLVPELAALEILSHFDEQGTAVTKPRQKPITLRLLLTHAAGLGYDGMSPKLAKYRASRGERIGGADGTLLGRFGVPLIYEPGTSWMYGAATDWAGRVVERASGVSLEAFMRENIWRPLGIRDMTFWIESRPDMKARLSEIAVRDGAERGQVVPYNGPVSLHGVTECMGGQGVYGTMPEYMKVLRSLLADDERLLKRSMTAQLFSPQLSEPSRAFLNGLRDRPAVWGMFVGEFPRQVELDWGLGGILTLQEDKGWRGKHTMIWSGLPNLFWFIDREKGLCGVCGMQVLPPGDDQAGELITQFEKAMYERASGGRGAVSKM